MCLMVCNGFHCLIMFLSCFWHVFIVFLACFYRVFMVLSNPWRRLTIPVNRRPHNMVLTELTGFDPIFTVLLFYTSKSLDLRLILYTHTLLSSIISCVVHGSGRIHRFYPIFTVFIMFFTVLHKPNKSY